MTNPEETALASELCEQAPADALLNQALAELRQGRTDSALEIWRKAERLRPDAARVFGVGGAIQAAAGRPALAIEAFQQALARDADYLAARQGLSVQLEASGRTEEALDCLQSLIERLPDNAELRRRLILLLGMSGRHADALAAAERALLDLPEAAELYVAKGVALRLSGELEPALAANEQALTLAPAYPPAWVEKGTVLLALNRLEEAMAAFDQALEEDGDYVIALLGLGRAELGLQMWDAAEAAFEQILARQPQNSDALFGLAMVFEGSGRLEAALNAYADVIAVQPDLAAAHNNIGKIYRDTGRLVEARRALERAMALNPSQPQIHSNLLLSMLYDPAVRPDEVAEAHREWGRRFGSPAGQRRTWANDRSPDRPLRVGIVSAELCRHAAAPLLSTALQALRRAGHDVICYATQPTEDETTARFRELASDWRSGVGLTDARLAQRIEEDAIDILIDITGHTAHSRLACFALRPAPVQTSWIAYPFTTGLPAIDYAIMDDIAVRPGEEKLFVEEVVRLPGGRFCFEPPDFAPAVSSPPMLRQGWVTFGSFNNVAKLTPEVLATWCRMLERVPTARLILKAHALGIPEVANRIRAAIVGAGVTAGRLELRPASDHAQLLAEYAEIDIALDPFPFGGGVTNCEALWMGVPVVTLPSWQPASRQTEAFLAAIGRQEWVADSIESYIETAARLGKDALYLADIRTEQRERMRRSPLCDVERLSVELDEALREMWRRFTASPHA